MGRWLQVIIHTAHRFHGGSPTTIGESLGTLDGGDNIVKLMDRCDITLHELNWLTCLLYLRECGFHGMHTNHSMNYVTVVYITAICA